MAFPSWRRRLPARILAALFVISISVYTVAWLYAVRLEPTSFLGVEYDTVLKPRLALVIRSVVAGSPAERAGLLAGDRVVELDGRPVKARADFVRAMALAKPGDRVRLTVDRRGTAERLRLEATLRERARGPGNSIAIRIARELTRSYPVLFFVGLAVVLFLRPNDANAWWLALLFAGFIGVAPVPEAILSPFLRGFSVSYAVLLNGSVGGIFLFFFSVFPEASPLDRRAPWLKWLWLVTGVSLSAGLAVARLVAGEWEPVLRQLQRIHFPADRLLFYHVFFGYGLGLLSLIGNGLGGSSAVRRKLRVIVWGTLLAVGPFQVVVAVATYLQVDPFAIPIWLLAPISVAASLLPVSFLYAVLRHRVLEIPALLKRSARYLLVQRGSVGLLVLLGIAAAGLFSASFPGRLESGRQPLAVGLGVGFGTLLIWTGSHLQRRLRERIDRAFFRSAYDARRILEDLAENARAVSRRDDLVRLLDLHLRSALYPAKLMIFAEAGDGTLRWIAGDRAPGDAETLPASARLLVELAHRGQPRELAPDGDDPEDSWPFAFGIECLVPILARQGRLNGLLALGPRLSEDPYSREDKRLLASVAGQAGIALDNIRLAEEIASRLATERLAAHELELARQVQAKLLPQEVPVLSTLELGGNCRQARAVGGDYFDFLELGPGRVGLVLADISGKGFPAALLMAGLQASLRSRSAADLDDLPRQLQAVHQLLYRSSESSRFATLFLGVYDDATRRLTYANCGHNPPLLLRAAGGLERLEPTGPVLGLFAPFECTTGQCILAAGDLLVVYSDGITETFDPSGEDFGEVRLLDLLQTHRQDPVLVLVERVLEQVRDFGGGEQQDDQTLLIARGR